MCQAVFVSLITVETACTILEKLHDHSMFVLLLHHCDFIPFLSNKQMKDPSSKI